MIVKKQFYGDRSLHSYVIPDGTREIGDWAFAGCTLLTRIEIPISVKKIGKGVFAGCENLKKVCLYGTGISTEGGSFQEEIMAVALRFFQGAEEIISAGENGMDAVLLAWDRACRRFLEESDEEGFRPFLAGGEEDYADDEKERERYRTERSLLKARVVVMRLLTSKTQKEYFEGYLKNNEMTLELLREAWSQPKQVVELLERTKIITEEKCREVMEKLPSECVEMKALLLQKLSEDSQTILNALFI